MDPNMNQNPQMVNPQMVQPQMIEPQMIDASMMQPQMLNQQEMVQAQVLNYNDVNAVAQEEKKSVSLKKLALFLGIIGVILVVGGVMQKFTLGDDINPTPTTIPATTKEITPTNGNSTCVLSDDSGQSGVLRSTIYVLNYNAEEKLTGYNKDYTVTTIEEDNSSVGKLQVEQKTLETLSNLLTKTPVTGYSIQMTKPLATDHPQVLSTKVIIDFSTLDINKLPAQLMTNTITKVDLQKDQEKASVKQTLEAFGYICQ